MLAHLEAAARELGYCAVWLETRAVNTRAVAFYERHGWRAVRSYERDFLGRARPFVGGVIVHWLPWRTNLSRKT